MNNKIIVNIKRKYDVLQYFNDIYMYIIVLILQKIVYVMFYFFNKKYDLKYMKCYYQIKKKKL